MTDKAENAQQDHTGKMTVLEDLPSLIGIQEESTVSRTVLTADGARVVLFGFDAGQVLTEHTAAMPVLIQVLDGRLRITGGDRTAELTPGSLIHMDTRLPHTVLALEPSRMALTMLDNKASAQHDSTGIGES